MPVSSRLAAAAAFWMIPLLAAAAPAPIGAAAIVTPDDLEVALVASEPMLVSPSNIDVDARGRVWVCEVTNYRGRRDTRPEGDRILVLEDTDGDGRADMRKVFHQGRDVDSALGICVIGEGPGRRVIVSCSPDVLVFHDVDGDLVADRTERLFTKTGMAQHDHSLHAFSVGPDGRCYFNFGNYGHAVHDRDGKPVVDRFGVVVNDSGKPYRQGMVFRCRPDGSDFEVLGHNFRNPFEVAADSFGTLWQSDNDDDGFAGVRINYVMEYGNFGYRDERSGEGWQIARSNLEPEVPRRHWHQNDPGVVPNLLATGAGSPTGICVYEGTALPERFRGAVVHCDALPNIVRAYPVSATGAGYSATILPIADGSADRWFRPSDVCVAPDGSLIVADWHDPGVGGHGMGDVEKGRIYRIAGRGVAWKVPAVDLGTVHGAVAALGSPNLCTRATALDRLARDPAAAGAALAAAFAAAGDVRLRARLAWAAGMLAPGAADAWVERLAACAEPELRTVALRLCRAVHGPGAAGGRADPRAVTAVAARSAADDSATVRREAALALKGIGGADADRAWAALAKRHEAGDRWQLEALGIGADGLPGASLWEGRLAAWKREAAAAWRQPAGREIVWRSRAAATPTLLAELIADPSVSAAEGLAMVRSLDFQEATAVRPAVMATVRSLSGPEDKIRAILPELVVRLHRDDIRDPAVAARVEEAAGLVPGTSRLVEIVRKFGLSRRTGELVALAAAEGTPDALASSSAAAAFELGGTVAVQQALAANDAAARRLTRALGLGGKPEALALLAAVVAGSASPAEKAAAIGALARSERGARRVIEIAKASGLDPQLTQAAALAIATSPWADVKKAAEGVLPIPAVQRGAKLPAVEELLRQAGVPDRGREVFATVGTCSKCHVVNGDGKAVGPNLSAVGTKLSREALYESILKPSAAISHNYDTHTAVLADGRSVTGLVVSKSDKQVVIRGVDGVDVIVPADDVEEMVRQPLSLMPADLAASLSAQQLVDLVAWLETLKAPQ